MIISKKKLEKMMAEEKAKQELEFERRFNQREEDYWRRREIENICERINKLERDFMQVERKVLPEKYANETKCECVTKGL